MISWPRRTLTFAGFVLSEYLRSRRFLAELLVGVAVVPLFMPLGREELDVPQFFTVVGLFVLVQSAYTTWVVVGQGRRPQGYVVLARPLGRSGYLIGHYLASVAMTVLVYLTLTLAILSIQWATNHPPSLSVEEWLLRTLPLLMDVAVISAFVTLITPLVLTPWPRLVALGLPVLALSSELKLLERLEVALGATLLHELFDLVLFPIALGFGLAIQSGYTSGSVWIFGHQLALALALLAIALFAFHRRELILVA